MTQLKMKIGDPKNTEEIAEWLIANPKNAFDPAILTYPTLRIVTSYTDGGNIAHLPSQQALVLESVAMNPKADAVYKPQAIRDLVKGQQLLASTFGIREMYFIASDPTVLEIAVNHGFERIAFPVVRLKL
jgi:hypothetical protein